MKKNCPIQKITILGGGSSGWMSALYLANQLNLKSNKKIKLTVIESSEIPTVGVGEGTLPPMQDYFKACAVNEDEWVNFCNATYKLGIKHVNWSGRTDANHWIYTFDVLCPYVIAGYKHIECWLGQVKKGRKLSFSVNTNLGSELMRNKKGPGLMQGPRAPFSGAVPYAYHFDAGLHGEFCKKKSIELGVHHFVDEVRDVTLDNDGWIECLKTKANGDVPGDLFIDCSGFRSLLLQDALQEPFISYSDSLLCDRAVAIPVPHEKNLMAINSYTTTYAQNAGWVWEIPLFNRMGYGYVYSSAFATRDEAEAELRTLLGKKAEGIEAKHISMKVGRSQNLWVKNCISIGLSGGFIEPLEATGLYLIQEGIENIVNYFPGNSFDPFLISEYNSVMQNIYDSLRDFITLHYCCTNREDTPFWKTNKNDLVLSASLQRKLDCWNKGVLWRNESTYLTEREHDFVFGYNGYISLLTGMQVIPETLPAILDHYGEFDIKKILAKLEQGLAQASANYPSHLEYLQWSRNIADRFLAKG